MSLFNTKQLFQIVLLIILGGCSSNDRKHKPDDDKNQLFLDYKIIAEEGNDNLLVMAQFKKGGEEGDALSLQTPATILLDGAMMEKDSAKIGGIYYEMYKPVDSFAGRHRFSFTNGDNRTVETEFNFQPFSLQATLPDTMFRNQMQLGFAGLDEGAMVRIVLTDTSFESEGVNELRRVREGKMEIDSATLSNLQNGPVQLTLTREYEQPVKTGGRLLILYTLRREFFLRD
jgi:hypothetical protein